MQALLKGESYMTLTEMRSIDPRDMDSHKMVQLGSVHVDAKSSQRERCRQFMAQIGNPYCYMDGKVKVKISFTATERTMDECVRSYLAGI